MPSKLYVRILGRARRYLKADRADRAEALCRAILRVAPEHARTQATLATVLHAVGKRDEACTLALQALPNMPDEADDLQRLADLLRSLGFKDQMQQALVRQADVYRKLLADGLDESFVRYDRHEVMLRLAGNYKDLERYADAEAILRAMLATHEDDPQAWFYLGLCRSRQEDIPDARHCYETSLRLRPTSAAAHLNLGCTLELLGDYAGAIEHYRSAIALRPQEAQPRDNLSMALLREGHYIDAWSDYEYRASKARTASVVRSALPYPEWRGEPIVGKRILLISEQGLGDSLQFVRYAQVLDEMGADVGVWATAGLETLVARTPGVRDVHRAPPTDARDFWVLMPSLPGLVHTTLSSIPHNVPYLFAAPERIPYWCERFGPRRAGTRRIGLVWAGNPAHGRDRFRSTSLDALLPLSRIPGIEWFSLQKGAARERLVEFAAWPMHDVGRDLTDFSDTAAAIANLDMVVAVDTSVAHLAGGMGKPVWIMLDPRPDWRWLRNREDSPWYPSARLFRQGEEGGWSPVVNAIYAALAAG